MNLPQNKSICNITFSPVYYKHPKAAHGRLTCKEEVYKDCGVDALKMSDFGIRPEECDLLARNARETMGGLFAAAPCALSHADCVAICQNSYR